MKKISKKIARKQIQATLKGQNADIRGYRLTVTLFYKFDPYKIEFCMKMERLEIRIPEAIIT